MTPHKHHTLKVLDSLEPNQAGETRPCPMDLERYLHDTSQILATDIVGWKQVPDYDKFVVLLKSGATFEITGQAIAFWQMNSLD